MNIVESFILVFFFFSSRRRHTRFDCDWSSDVCSSDLAEYRIPLRDGVEAAGFFDLGSGWLLPNWLGPSKPNLLSTTNGVLHGSTGIQLQWTIPGIQVPFRSYYSLNVRSEEHTSELQSQSNLVCRLLLEKKKM